MRMPLTLCKRTTIINFARAELVDNDALFDALKQVWLNAISQTLVQKIFSTNLM